MPRSGSLMILTWGERKASATARVPSVEAPSISSISLCGWSWARKEVIVRAIVASALRQTVMTEIFIGAIDYMTAALAGSSLGRLRPRSRLRRSTSLRTISEIIAWKLVRASQPRILRALAASPRRRSTSVGRK